MQLNEKYFLKMVHLDTFEYFVFISFFDKILDSAFPWKIISNLVFEKMFS